MARAKQGLLSLGAAHYVLSWEFMKLETKELSEDKTSSFFKFNFFF